MVEELLFNRFDVLKKRQKYFLIEEDELADIVESGELPGETQEFCFESRYDMNYPTDVWCQQFDAAGYDPIIYIFGIGHYLYLKKLIERVRFSVVVVYEPNINCFIDFLGKDIEDVLNTKGLYFITGKERHESLGKSLGSFLNYYNRKQLYIANIPNYIKRYNEDYEEFCNIIQKRCDNIIFDKSTEIVHEKVQTYNYLHNVFSLINEAGIQELNDAVQAFIEYPAVVVSAGPSLDKNVKVLDEYRGRVFIGAVDAALNTLKKNNITPDLIVTMDPKFEQINAMEDEEFNRLPMIVNLISGNKLLKSHKGRKFFDVQQDNFIGAVADKYNKTIPMLGTGGSVANSAFSFLEFVGFQNIILIGQDLGYPNNKLHASDAFEDEGDIEETSEKYFYVEDVFGGKVLTEKNMNLYRLWFEDSIRANKSLNVMDATEGGALIKGTVIMTLVDALETYCPLEKRNFVEMINDAGYLFDDEERLAAREEITGFYTSIDETIHKLKNGKRLYNKIEDLYRKGKHHSREFAKTIKDIKDLTNYIDYDPQMALFSMYAVKERTEIVDEMVDHTEDSFQEIRMLAETGRKILDAYILAGDRLKEDWNKYNSENN